MSQNLYFLYTILGPCITCIKISCLKLLSILGMRQNDHLEDDIFKCIFLDENFHIFIEIVSKFVPKVQLTITSIDSDNGLSPGQPNDCQVC